MEAAIMAAKRKTKHPAKPREDLSAPSKWRLQHGDIGPATRVADTESGTPIMQRRCIDTLGLMLAKGILLTALGVLAVHYGLQPKVRDAQASAEGGLEIVHRGHQHHRIGR
jgi:hypothetical protein